MGSSHMSIQLICLIFSQSSLPPDIVSVSVLMYGATISQPIALDTAAQKQNGHVIRGAPCRERRTGRETGRVRIYK